MAKKKTHFQARAGKPNEKIFPKFQIVGTIGDHALPQVLKFASPHNIVMRQKSVNFAVLSQCING
jgi:hypothetical protein